MNKTILFFFILLMNINLVYAKSCRKPEITAQKIKDAKVIAHGKIISQKKKSKYGKNLKAQIPFEISTFKILKAWRGVKVGEDFTTIRNTYWGDTQDIGQESILILNKKEDGLFLTSVCGGETFPVNKENIKKIKSFLK